MINILGVSSAYLSVHTTHALCPKDCLLKGLLESTGNLKRKGPGRCLGLWRHTSSLFPDPEADRLSSMMGYFRTEVRARGQMCMGLNLWKHEPNWPPSQLSHGLCYSQREKPASSEVWRLSHGHRKGKLLADSDLVSQFWEQYVGFENS